MTELQTPVTAKASGRRRGTSVALALLGGAASNQAGAAVGATMFSAVGPLGVVALRQVVAAMILMPIARPPLRGRSASQLWPAFALGACIVIMNSFLYLTIQRLGLGLAVTLEFLGPLSLALITSRRWVDGICAVLAGLGVVLITGAGGTTDLLGVLFGLCAAGGWAGYILLNRTIGIRLPGLQGTALATSTAAIIMVPMAVLFIPLGLFTPQVLLTGIVVGIMASVVPYCVDVWALRRAKTGLFSLMQSIHPLMAVLAGTVILGQLLSPWQLVAVVMITLANLLAITRTGR